MERAFSEFVFGYGCTCVFDYYLCRLMDFNSWVIKCSFIFFFFYYFGKIVKFHAIDFSANFCENIVPNKKLVLENLKDSKNRGWIRKSSVKRHLRHLPSFFLSISVSGGTNRYVGDFRKEKMKEQCPTVNNLVSGKVYTIGVGVQLRSDTAPPRAIYGC